VKETAVYSTQPKKYRHEYKHVITYADYLALRARLSAVAKRDKNAGADGIYRIRSLYFDNVYDKALKEKLDGINHREKFRIRFYNDDLSFIRLEKKSKVNGLCGKVSTKITKEECEKLLNGDMEWMLQRNDGLLTEFYSKIQYQELRPKTVVEYLREPFVFEPGNVRVTLDSEIRTGLHEERFLDPDMATMSTGNEIVLEVKYDEFLPEVIRNIVQVERARTSAYSKYAVARIYG